ncbi:hypothetical protein M8J76_008811 [Diaphorina citri]|nr:hypothetical protein M8J76_008811 [Diaphorina citri]
MSEAKEGDPGGGGGNPLPPNLNSTDGNAVVMETTEARASSGAQNLDGNTASSGQKHLVLYKPGMRFDVLTEENSDEVRSNNRNNYNTQYPPLPSNVPTNHRNITRYVPPAISDIRRPKRKSDKEMDNRESNQNKKNRQHLEEMARMTKPESYYTGNQISQLMYKGLEENKQHKANHEHQQWMKLTHPTIAFSGIPNSSEFEDFNMEQNFSLEHSERNENTYNSNYHGSSYPGSPDFS